MWKTQPLSDQNVGPGTLQKVLTPLSPFHLDLVLKCVMVITEFTIRRGREGGGGGGGITTISFFLFIRTSFS